MGLWSHMAYADAPTHPTIGAQVRVFEEAVGIARAAGLTAARLHLANSAATVALPDTWYDMVRPGIAVYGLDPLGGDPAEHGLRPAMTVRATAALTKRVPAGVGVSYGHTYFPEAETTLLLVPVQVILIAVALTASGAATTVRRALGPVSGARVVEPVRA